MRAVPDLPNYSLWRPAPEKTKDQHFLLSQSAQVHSQLDTLPLQKDALQDDFTEKQIILVLVPDLQLFLPTFGPLILQMTDWK